MWWSDSDNERESKDHRNDTRIEDEAPIIVDIWTNIIKEETIEERDRET